MTEKDSSQVSDTKHSFQESTWKFNIDIIKGCILTDYYNNPYGKGSKSNEKERTKI